MTDNNTPLVSVIVPVYNAEKYLNRCVDSILSQTMKDFELLLIDDGSQDESSRICDEYAEENARVKVFHKPNGGVSSARNLGIDQAKGKYIIFIDSDDYWLLPNCLELLTSLMNEMGCDCVRGEYQGFDEIGNVVVEPKVKRELEGRLLTPYELLRYGLVGEFFGWLFMFRRSTIGDLRYDEQQSFLEDMDFISRFMIKAQTCAYTSECFYAYLKRNDSVSNSPKYANVECSFKMSDKFDSYSKLTNGNLKQYYMFYSVMMYLWTLSTLALNPYYGRRKLFIRNLKLNRLWHRCILRVFNNGSFMINRKYIQLLLSPLMNVYLIRQKNSSICNTLQ